ncbi:L-threonine ammonia-lyase [Pseudonocardia autotrophica]|uniref:L-threonine dehydratase n=2 Tax=Pseudonocardia TaxID=1847 RepID=A0A1Y2MQS5_PSEAH|nr:L-threonine dehydratase biosynthetic IlvA [Pseudonocardia autotrophica]TDN73698.1 L-threonine ammonia-lyase [Pseudonocardia autotrophica]BBG04442.1 L-threonine dehydratase [Pseudonocardia autotrophica]GEC27312.1 L-threonine dehydratase [Pseudonocardia saturnea]
MDPSTSPAPGTRVSAADVDDAAARLRAVIGPTPLQLNPRLSDALGGEVWLKREDLQPVRSYKIRGAYNLIAQLPETDRAAGVVCASAGNHAQGVAFACQRLGVRGRVYLPGTTPRQKRDRVARLGRDAVEVRVVGNTYDDAAAAARADAESTGATQVPAFDDPRTVAGQGTIVREILGQLADPPDVLVVPVGGGGLLAGALTYLREHSPGTRIVGVEPAGAASMAAAVAAGSPVELATLDPFVDGAAVRRVGDATFDVVRESGIELVAVPEGRICVEMLALYQSDGIIAEPAGALSPAALDRLDIPRDATTVCLLSGGNNDVSRYADIVERALVFEGRKHYFLVEFPQEPGALRRFLDDVLGPDDDITLFEYTKRSNRETGPALVGVELGSPDDLPALLKRMEEAPPHIEQIPPDSPLFGFIL